MLSCGVQRATRPWDVPNMGPSCRGDTQVGSRPATPRPSKNSKHSMILIFSLISLRMAIRGPAAASWRSRGSDKEPPHWPGDGIISPRVPEIREGAPPWGDFYQQGSHGPPLGTQDGPQKFPTGSYMAPRCLFLRDPQQAPQGAPRGPRGRHRPTDVPSGLEEFHSEKHPSVFFPLGASFLDRLAGMREASQI